MQDANSVRVATQLYGTKTTGGDFVKMAEAMGCYGKRVDWPGEIIAAIKRSAEVARSGRPALLEIVTDGPEQEMSYRGF
ncbi:MAG: hypothetical protein IIC85_14605 [Chloroflexi bacterium]|nr:hypothetical protein [Chloroflexota bacterium]